MGVCPYKYVPNPIQCNHLTLCGTPFSNMVLEHVMINLHFVREHVAIGDVRVLHVPTTSQFADIFTKGLPPLVFSEFMSSLIIRNS
jgi:hypothetical protein